MFFYRSSPEPLIQTFSLEVTWSNPPPVTPGTAAVRLDTRGRLVELQVVPPARPDGSPTGTGTGWAAPLFAAAGLDPARFTRADPARTPPAAFDAQAAWAGAWGVSFAMNLTPDKATGLGSWTPEMFVAAIRTGKHQGTGRPILPPMPWNWYKNMTDDDLKAVFAYLQSLPPINNPIPDPLPPDKMP